MEWIFRIIGRIIGVDDFEIWEEEDKTIFPELYKDK